MMDECAFCKESVNDGQETVKLSDKGCDRIKKAIDQCKSDSNVSQGQVVHVKCRREFINPNAIKAYKRKLSQTDDQSSKKYPLRSATIDYQSQCIFCGNGGYHYGHKPEYKLICICTMDFKEKNTVDNL
jgi:hypothetical protein